MTDRVVAVIHALGPEYKHSRTVEEILAKIEELFPGDYGIIVPVDKAFHLTASIGFEPNELNIKHGTSIKVQK
jgi:hypothetical protein